MTDHYAWFASDRDAEIARWIDENLTETTYAIGRKARNKRSIIVYFGSEMDLILFKIVWGDAFV
ncbi:hypothetical protein P6144_00230 [Sphingomonas sp. HITSZ_GF]|uniref:hypothetical protein n=1 Tax=Sphingomonas sp. HITSZ_GF TaxID=3037247 RepID=UPI00240D82DB|nr:hypothetical protein [Sphingomonas sp. HITSZ_GF]MDG2532062.1 hypothetical protein [Sphingomonas sp. HITSZ_GF]